MIGFAELLVILGILAAMICPLLIVVVIVVVLIKRRDNDG